jgi:hypothetical protein
MHITTIIPTLCEKNRREQLLRAIASIHAASTHPVRVLVVINGQRFDASLVEHLQGRNDVDVIQVAEGSQTNAQLVGRRAVATEFFSFLDDDDEYLPNGLDVRMSLLVGNTAAVAVTNGYVCRDGGDKLLYSRIPKVPRDLFRELFQQNWLASCNHLFRTASVASGYFEDAPTAMEWTWLAFRLAMDDKTIAARDVPTFRINDTPGSLSKSTSFLASRVEIYNRMLAQKPPRHIANIIRRKSSSAWHDIATAELQLGVKSKARVAHLRSMTCHWSGVKFLPFSRRLVFIPKTTEVCESS